MISDDLMVLALLTVTVINFMRYITSLRTLIYLMKEAHPLLYQQVEGRNFFSSPANVNKQARLFHYLRHKEYDQHHDQDFVCKCNKVRELFIISCGLLVITLIVALSIY